MDSIGYILCQNLAPIQTQLLTTPSGGAAGGKKEERDKDERLAEEGGEWDDGPPGT